MATGRVPRMSRTVELAAASIVRLEKISCHVATTGQHKCAS